MGVQGLTKLLGDMAPSSIHSQKFENYFGRKIAVDASMHMYQFLVVVGRVGDQVLTNEAGEETSHLQGMFFRTARMVEAGIKPVYVFDGKPPQLKLDELSKRKSRHEEAAEALQEAKEKGDQETIEKYSKRTVRVTQKHNEECKRLLALMGIPIIEAPSEAEAQCASMCKEGVVYAAATEDMDALTFGAPRLARHLMAPSSQKKDVMEFDLAQVLQELEMSHDQFIDLCILCGCDYCDRIGGVGPVTAFKLIKEHGTIEGVLKHIRKSSSKVVPDPFPFAEAREFFRSPDVLSGDQLPALKWGDVDTDGLVKFLVEEKNFSEDRVRKTAEKLKAARGKSTQGRLESFFGPVSVKPSTKRKEAPTKGKAAAAKRGKLGPVGKKSK